MIRVGKERIDDVGFIDFGQPLGDLHRIAIFKNKYLEKFKVAMIYETPITINQDGKFLVVNIKPAELGKFAAYLTRRSDDKKSK